MYAAPGTRFSLDRRYTVLHHVAAILMLALICQNFMA